MIKKFIEEFKVIDKKILSFMKIGIIISFLICVFSTYILELNNCFSSSFVITKAALILFQSGLMFMCCFISCGFVIDRVSRF